jgi:hypothetical protein
VRRIGPGERDRVAPSGRQTQLGRVDQRLGIDVVGLHAHEDRHGIGAHERVDVGPHVLGHLGRVEAEEVAELVPVERTAVAGHRIARRHQVEVADVVDELVLQVLAVVGGRGAGGGPVVRVGQRGRRRGQHEHADRERAGGPPRQRPRARAPVPPHLAPLVLVPHSVQSVPGAATMQRSPLHRTPVVLACFAARPLADRGKRQQRRRLLRSLPRCRKSLLGNA